MSKNSLNFNRKVGLIRVEANLGGVRSSTSTPWDNFYGLVLLTRNNYLDIVISFIRLHSKHIQSKSLGYQLRDNNKTLTSLENSYGAIKN